MVHLCGGSFLILSGDGIYEEKIDYKNGDIPDIEKKKIQLDFYFQGTFVDIILNSKPGMKIFSKNEKIPDDFTLIR